MHNLKLRIMLVFSGLAEDLCLGDSLSDSSQGLCQRGQEGAGMYRNSNKPTKPKKLNITGLLLIKENRTSQVNEFNVFLCVWEDTAVCALDHSFDLHHYYLGSVFCFSLSWILSACTVCGWGWVAALMVHHPLFMIWHQHFLSTNPTMSLRSCTPFILVLWLSDKNSVPGHTYFVSLFCFALCIYYFPLLLLTPHQKKYLLMLQHISSVFLP